MNRETTGCAFDIRVCGLKQVKTCQLTIEIADTEKFTFRAERTVSISF